MNIPLIPVACGVALTAMSGAALSHWWSVRQFVAAIESDAPIHIRHADPMPPVLAAASPAPAPAAIPVAPAPAPASVAPAATAAPESGREDFYTALLSRMESLQTQNRDLLDQLAETNRDLMKLEFRVDTHSESFRPLPISEDRADTSFEDHAGVLPPRPPRAQPVILPELE